MRCFVLTHRKFVNKAASKYLSEHSLKLQEWAKDVNKGCTADILALVLLCTATDTHCFVHTRSGYGTTLANNPQSHTEYSQRCNLHLSYVGKGVYVQHKIRTVTVAYDIFDLPEPLKLDVQMETITIGTCTADKQETLDKLFRLDITSSTTAETKKYLLRIPPRLLIFLPLNLKQLDLMTHQYWIYLNPHHNLVLHQQLHLDSQPLK